MPLYPSLVPHLIAASLPAIRKVKSSNEEMDKLTGHPKLVETVCYKLRYKVLPTASPPMKAEHKRLAGSHIPLVASDSPDYHVLGNVLAYKVGGQQLLQLGVVSRSPAGGAALKLQTGQVLHSFE